MLSQLRKVLAVSALSLVAVTAAHAADKHKVAFVPQLIGIPYFNAMEAGATVPPRISASISSIPARSTPTRSTSCRSCRT